MRTVLVALTVALMGCGPEPAQCTPAPLPDCPTVDAPTFVELHAAVIGPSCGTGATCHVPGDTISDLDLASASTARTTLIEGGYVVPGSPQCSELVQRMTSGERLFVMPPTGRLSVEQQCAVIAWVRDGAL